MPNLIYSHQINERRKFGKETVNQTMTIVVDYDPENDSLEIISVNIYQGGVFVAEISKLLDKAEGCPLATMIDAIDWPSLHAEKLHAA